MPDAKTPFVALHLTTPVVTGEHVREAQHALKDNRFGQNFHPGKTDGHYGDHTAAAARRAKYELGFRKSSWKGRKRFVYNQKLHRVLLGERKLSALERRRRARRIMRAEKYAVGAAALAIARTQVGTKEQPAESNLTKYGKWYGVQGQPWCAIFVSWCFGHVRQPFWQTTRVTFKYAFVPFVVGDARAGRNGLQVVSRTGVRVGDVVCFDWEGDGQADHIGFFDGWINQTSGSFRTVEGNTAFGNDSNGGEVMRRERTISQVQVFVRVSAH